MLRLSPMNFYGNSRRHHKYISTRIKKKKGYEIPPEFENLWNMKLVNGFSSMKVEHTWRMRDKSTIHVYAI